MRWVDVNKGGKEKPEYRCRMVAKEIKKDRREDLFAATPPLEAKNVLFSLSAGMPEACLDFADVVRAYFPREGQERRVRGSTEGGRRAENSRRRCTTRRAQPSMGSWSTPR